MLITPAPPKTKDKRQKTKDIIQERLLQSKLVCFYDAKVRQPPKSWAQFLKSNYADVKFSDTESAIMVLHSVDTTVLQEPTITVANFCTLNDFIKGSDLITTQLDLMNLGPLKGLDSAPLPMKTQPLSLYMAWHERDDKTPSHQWLRQEIRETVRLILSEK